jgi:hypothetical protein
MRCATPYLILRKDTVMKFLIIIHLYEVKTNNVANIYRENKIGQKKESHLRNSPDHQGAST